MKKLLIYNETGLLSIHLRQVNGVIVDNWSSIFMIVNYDFIRCSYSISFRQKKVQIVVIEWFCKAFDR